MKTYDDDNQTWLFVYEDTYTKIRYTTMEAGNYLRAANRSKPRVAKEAGIPATRLTLVNQAREGEIIQTRLETRTHSELLKVGS